MYHTVMNNETWRAIPEFSQYEASSLGRIRRITFYSRGHTEEMKNPGFILKQYLHNIDGYYTVILMRHKKRHMMPVHKAVAYAFLGPKPSPIHQINHMNQLKSDNSSQNLEWCTPKENCWTGKRHPIKLFTKEVDEIRTHLKKGTSVRTLSKRYGIHGRTVYRIKRFRSWKNTT